MQRWVVGPEQSGSKQLIEAISAAGFKTHERWRYAPSPEPFTVMFWDGSVEVVVEFETPDGIVVTGPEHAVRRLQEELGRLSSKGD